MTYRDLDRKPWKPNAMFHSHSLMIGLPNGTVNIASDLNKYRKKATEVANKAITKMIKEG